MHQIVKSAPAVWWLLLAVLDSFMMGKSFFWTNFSRPSVRHLGSIWHSKPLLLLLVVPASEWARAVLERAQHPLLGNRVHQWVYAGGAGEQIPGDGHQRSAEPV